MHILIWASAMKMVLEWLKTWTKHVLFICKEEKVEIFSASFSILNHTWDKKLVMIKPFSNWSNWQGEFWLKKAETLKLYTSWDFSLKKELEFRQTRKVPFPILKQLLDLTTLLPSPNSEISITLATMFPKTLTMQRFYTKKQLKKCKLRP